MKLTFLLLILCFMISSLCVAQQKDRNELLESRSLRTHQEKRILYSCPKGYYRNRKKECKKL